MISIASFAYYASDVMIMKTTMRIYNDGLAGAGCPREGVRAGNDRAQLLLGLGNVIRNLGYRMII